MRGLFVVAGLAMFAVGCKSSEPASAPPPETASPPSPKVTESTAEEPADVGRCGGLEVALVAHAQGTSRPAEGDVLVRDCAAQDAHTHLTVRALGIGTFVVRRKVTWPRKLSLVVEGQSFERFSSAFGDHHLGLDTTVEGGVRVSKREPFDCDWGTEVPSEPTTKQPYVRQPCTRVRLDIEHQALEPLEEFNVAWVDYFRH